MSVDNMSWVFKHSPYKLGARLIHLALADTANDTYDSLVWDSQGTIATKAGVSRATVNSTLKQMVRDGWLEEVDGTALAAVRMMMKDKRANVYRFLTCQKSDTHSEPGPVKSESAMCQVDDARCVKSTDSHLLLSQEVTQGEHKPDPMIGFDKFWEAYPKRKGVRPAKQDTTTLWAKLSLDDKRAAFRGAVNYQRFCDNADEFPMNADKFLRNRTWMDWQDPPEGGALVPRGGRPNGPRDPMRRGGSRLQELADAAHEQDQGRQMALVR